MMSSCFPNIIVTGANRGIGLEFIRQLLDLNSNNIIATSRSSSPELEVLKSNHANLHILYYDATNYESYPKFVEQVRAIVGDAGIDLLVNNAGILLKETLDTVDPKNVLTNIEVNAVAPLILTKALLPLMRIPASKGRKVVVANISSILGSISDGRWGEWNIGYSYRSSKAAQNMISKTLSLDLSKDKIIVLALHPGWVQTDMGTSQAEIDVKTSVSGLLEVIGKTDASQSGHFLAYDGKELPW